MLFRSQGGQATTEIYTRAYTLSLHDALPIRETLAACGGSRIETARRLGISERTLRYRLAKAREQGEDITRNTRMSA